MNFAEIFDALKQGKKVKRKSWLQKHLQQIENPGIPGKKVFAIFSESANVLTRWIITEEDIFAEDWEIIDA